MRAMQDNNKETQSSTSTNDYWLSVHKLFERIDKKAKEFDTFKSKSLGDLLEENKVEFCDIYQLFIKYRNKTERSS